MHKNKGSQWLGAFALVAGALTSGCSSGTTEENATEMVSQTVETASDSSDAVEVSSLMRGMNALRSEAVEGFHCDASPDITYIEVCGQNLPATVHLEWTDCAAPERRGGGGHGGGAPVGGTIGGAVSLGGGGGRGGGGQPPPEGTSGDAPPAGGKGGACGPSFGPSSGKVDITYTYGAAEDCSGSVKQDQSVTFQISRTGEEGDVSTVQGTTTSSAQLVAGAPPQQKSTQADVTRTRTDASGTVVSSVHLTGSMNVEFSSDTPPVRTVNGSYTETFLDGTQGTVTLENIVRAPRNVCQWPTSGTLTRASADGQSHTLVFGPDCGTATLDGAAVTLPEHGRKGGR
ncbi:hypothetical protein [Hyalangium rubrum]|uniref:Lipoprotein n=1 Tax=Hyalangium rubrum TaxID=3103134 RepID=A0ABU5GUV3_9BACT|nr:hypothetical protein [Hyalangium sp. s54d21]MDY7224960.1 hypothetical protein [Hyalangium sp. s54d21]